MLVLESREPLYPYCYSVLLHSSYCSNPNIAVECNADPSFSDEISQVIARGLRCLSLFGWIGEINKTEASSRTAYIECH